MLQPSAVVLSVPWVLAQQVCIIAVLLPIASMTHQDRVWPIGASGVRETLNLPGVQAEGGLEVEGVAIVCGLQQKVRGSCRSSICC
jgi:hypothetical protein